MTAVLQELMALHMIRETQQGSGCGKHHDQKQPWGERVYFILQLMSPSLREARAEVWKQEEKQRPPRSTANWLVTMACLFSLISHSIQKHHPRGSTTHKGWALPHQ